jgi:hypothetical protein
MNLNSLIIVTDGSTARFFRTAQTNLTEEPVELIEMESIAPTPSAESSTSKPASESRVLDASRHGAVAHDNDSLRTFSEQIAQHAARFGQYHLCNPVIVAGPPAVCVALNAALAHEMPTTYTRCFVGELVRLPRVDLLHDLEKRGAFTLPHERYQT